jgi:hypothetical protein
VLLETDHPFDMAEFDWLEYLTSAEGVDPKIVEAIVGGNP